MSVNVPRTFVFSDGIGVSASQLESEISNLVQIINNADAGLLTWNNVKAVNLTVTNAPTFSNLIDSGLTASRVVVSDTNKQLASSAVTSTTLAFLDATSSVQTQINTKAPLASPTFTGTVTVPNGSGATDAAAFGQIKYRQCVVATSTTATTTTSSTFTAATNQSVAITVVSGSRVKVTISTPVSLATTAAATRLTIKRGTTELSGATNGFWVTDQTTGNIVMASFSIIDSSPAVGSNTYQVFFSNNDNSHSVGVGLASAISVIMAEEIV